MPRMPSEVNRMDNFEIGYGFHGEEPEPRFDNVNKPEHYNHNRKGIECIQAIEASMSAEEFLGYLKGNILKYTWRYRYKHGAEDLKKAEWYNNLLIERYNEHAKA